MIGNKIFDCQEMFRHACTFCECADMALDKLQHDILHQIHIPVGRDIFNFKEILYESSTDAAKFNPLDTYENKNFITN